MKKLIIALSVVLTLNACYNVNESEVVTPEELISKEKLVDILTDIQLVEAGFTISENRKHVTQLKPKYYQAVLDKYDISLIQLRENMNYYQNDSKQMEDIYESVLAKLSKIQSGVLVEIEELERIQDSLSKVADSLEIDTTTLIKAVDSFPDYLKKTVVIIM